MCAVILCSTAARHCIWTVPATVNPWPVPATTLHIRMQDRYRYVLIRQKADELHLSQYREELKNALRKSMTEQECHVAFLEDNSCLLMLLAKEDADCMEQIYKKLMRFTTQLEREIPTGVFGYSMYEEAVPLAEVKRCAERCARAMELGPLLYLMHV